MVIVDVQSAILSVTSHLVVVQNGVTFKIRLHIDVIPKFNCLLIGIVVPKFNFFLVSGSSHFVGAQNDVAFKIRKCMNVFVFCVLFR